MNRSLPFLSALVLTAGLIVGCSQQGPTELSEQGDKVVSASVTNRIGNISPGAVRKGVVYVKISREAAIPASLPKDRQIRMSALPTTLSATLQSVGATRMERVFPPTKHEKRLRAMDMDTWYYMYYDESTSPDASRVMTRLLSAGNPDIEAVELVPIIKRPMGRMTPLSEAEARAITSTAKAPFDDPLLSRQWHYHNDGTIDSRAVPGADINLFPAWKVETGKPSVIVAILDGGIDYEHPDLAESMWINEAELNGIPGEDNDGNGYVGDIHGANFVNFEGKTPEDYGKIVPDDESHGTHVAGTLAARNNNGIGVAGIAGGDGTPQSGVRLMSCQIFRKEGESGNAPEAFQYAADNGAVITQNSWGYPAGADYFPTPLKKAIDYFIKYAGCDDDGNQLPDSPMKGGVVLFAAGNDNADGICYPAMYERVISVSASGWDWTRASYTNRGDWVTLCAPGGDISRWVNKASGILSTLSPKANVAKTFLEGGAEYGWFQGTSMATPHASGVAALVCSKYGGPGFTADDLRAHMMSFRNKDINTVKGNEPGRLGAGYLDAAIALEDDGGKAPEKPMILPMTEENNPLMERFYALNITWHPAKDEDSMNGIATQYLLYFSEIPITESNYEKGKMVTIPGLTESLDDVFSYRYSNLKDGTTYYFALIAMDKWGHKSDPTLFERATSENHPPVVLNAPVESVEVLSIEEAKFTLDVTDKDGHKWDFELTGDTKGVFISRKGDQLICRINAVLDAGDYAFTLTLTDELGKSSDLKIPFSVVSYEKPRLVTSLDDQIIGLNQGRVELPLGGAFGHSVQVPLTYSVKSSDGSILTAEIDEEGTLSLTPHQKGEVYLSLKAEDRFNSVSTGFRIRVVEDANAAVYLVYPIPVKTDLNLVINPDLASIRVILTTFAGEKVLSKSLVANAETGIATLHLSDLAAGAYRLSVESDKGTYRKVINKY